MAGGGGEKKKNTHRGLSCRRFRDGGGGSIETERQRAGRCLKLTGNLSVHLGQRRRGGGENVKLREARQRDVAAIFV